ncbi:MAG: hypothetical protein AAF327_12330 [Cyanobacteria bacterium P01_A01_bin.37]
MLKRVLKPGDIHLMAPDEEYCRIIYERQWNAPDIFNLSVELYDKGGVRVRQSFQKVNAKDEKRILQDVIGDGWETIFTQDYEDWLIRCQKRPRTSSSGIRYLSPIASDSGNGRWRNILVGTFGLGVAALIVGVVLGQQPGLLTADNTPLASDGTTSEDIPVTESISEPGTSSSADAGDSADTGDMTAEDRTAEDSESDSLVSEDDGTLTIGDVLFDDSDTQSPDDGRDALREDDELDDKTDATASPDTTVVTVAIADDEDNGAIATTTGTEPDPFVSAVRLAQAAVIDGRTARTRDGWEDLAERWQEAADLMADVSSSDERYDIAQDRVERYENNRDIALSEAEKADSE